MESNHPAEINFESTSTSIQASRSDQPDQQVVFVNDASRCQEGEVIRIELYEEVPTIHRGIRIREKVEIKKILTSEDSDT